MAVRGLISHIDLNVMGGTESIELYALVLGHLGFERHDLAEDRAWWSVTYPGGGVLGIEVRPPASTPPRDRHERYAPGIDHLAFHAESRDDVDALESALVDAGYAIAEPAREYDYTPGYYALAFDDPSGIRLEVVHEPAANP